MKKLLIASTALVATAGMAAADGHATPGVSLSGYAEMGIADTGNGVELFHDFDVKFSLSGETDNGLTFGATMDLDEQLGGTSATAGNASSVWIKGGFGNLTMGDTDGALDFVNQEIGMLSAIADDHTSHFGYFNGAAGDGAQGGQILRYDNTFGDFGVAVSIEMDDTASNDTMGLGLSYNLELGATSVGLSLGYQENDSSDVTAVSAKTSFSGVDVIVNFADFNAGTSYMGIGLGYTTGDLSMTANYGEYSNGGLSIDGFGLAVNYSLGGGAVVMAGYTDNNVNTGDDTFSLGLGLSF
jgi:outer membrane protein OmpU